MDELFELIDLKSGNLVGDYDQIEDALAILRTAAERHGRTAIEHYSLMRIQGDDQSLVAMNEDLIGLVESSGFRPIAKVS